jgi:hypothetical protein
MLTVTRSLPRPGDKRPVTAIVAGRLTRPRAESVRRLGRPASPPLREQQARVEQAVDPAAADSAGQARPSHLRLPPPQPSNCERLGNERDPGGLRARRGA